MTLDKRPTESTTHDIGQGSPIRLWHGWSLGTTALGLLVVQVITGLALMTVYSPSTQSAWGSVWYVQTQVSWGWLVRGMHHFASDALIIVLVLWALQVVLLGPYRRAHPALWRSLLVLILLALGLSLSGHLLPWDQEGYWGTMVRINILARSPVIGDALRRIVIGGSELGQLTLTRFYTLHVIILPALLALVFWRRCKACAEGENEEGPGQLSEIKSPRSAQKKNVRLVLFPLIGFAAVVGIVCYVQLVMQSSLLAAPADASSANFPARPEWHTLFLFEWLKYFHSPTGEMIGAIVLPTAILMILMSIPILDWVFPHRMAQLCVLSIIATLVVGVGFLTTSAILTDLNPSDQSVAAVRGKLTNETTLTAKEEALLRARAFHEKRRLAERTARRALELAGKNGIPPAGALELLAKDPLTRGPMLFAANCASCHRYHGHDGTGAFQSAPATSSDLGDFATRTWILGLLENPMGASYFGLMAKPDGDAAHTRMSKWVREMKEDYEDEPGHSELMANFEAVAAYLEDESLRPKRLVKMDTSAEDWPSSDDPQEALILKGRQFFMSTCNECHSYDGEREGTFRAPEMAGYGSVAWIELMIAHPDHDQRYRSRGKEPAQMPSFADRLSEQDRNMIAHWLHESRQIGPVTPRTSGNDQ